MISINYHTHLPGVLIGVEALPVEKELAHSGVRYPHVAHTFDHVLVRAKYFENNIVISNIIYSLIDKDM